MPDFDFDEIQKAHQSLRNDGQYLEPPAHVRLEKWPDGSGEDDHGRGAGGGGWKGSESQQLHDHTARAHEKTASEERKAADNSKGAERQGHLDAAAKHDEAAQAHRTVSASGLKSDQDAAHSATGRAVVASGNAGSKVVLHKPD